MDVIATKADDARVQVENWDTELAEVMQVLYGEKVTMAAEAIRDFYLR